MADGILCHVEPTTASHKKPHFSSYCMLNENCINPHPKSLSMISNINNECDKEERNKEWINVN